MSISFIHLIWCINIGTIWENTFVSCTLVNEKRENGVMGHKPEICLMKFELFDSLKTELPKICFTSLLLWTLKA